MSDNTVIAPVAAAARLTPPGCPACGSPVTTMATACTRCGAAITGAPAAVNAERIRQRLQESIGDAFQLLELLGRGGMGIVFRARELSLDREVALKVLTLDPVLNADAYGRFEREAKLAAKLEHPNIVPIFAVGHRESVAYYTMRLVRGGSVEDLLRERKRLDLDRTIAILREVAAALDHAHRNGVVHRDVKPANVMLTEDGHAMVADFGIAKALGPADGTTATATGVLGSPGYMAPEQWRGESLTGRADQYALAVLAFEMLTGRRPFETAQVQDLIKLHLAGVVPDASSLRPGLSPGVDAALHRALAKYPTERFGTATAFIDALAGRRPVGASGQGPRYRKYEPPPPEPRTSIAPFFFVTIIVVAAAIIAVPSLRTRAERGWNRTIARATRLVAPEGAAPSGVDPAAPADSSGARSAGDSTAAPSASAPTRVVPVAAAAPRRALERPPITIDGDTGGATGFRVLRPIEDGFIRVTIQGGTAKVRIDGRTYGFAPLVARIEPGTHNVTVEGAGDAFEPAQVGVAVAASDTTDATFAARGLAPESAADRESTPRR